MVSKKEKTKVIGARLPIKEIELFEKTGKDLKELIINFNKEYYSTTPIGLKMAKKELETNEKKMKSELKHIQIEKERIDDLINNQNNCYDLNYYNENVKKAVNNVIGISKQQNKHITELKEDVFMVNANNCNLEIEEFKKIIKETVS